MANKTFILKDIGKGLVETVDPSDLVEIGSGKSSPSGGGSGGVGLNPFAGKTIETNGDSITWYDGKTYVVTHAENPNTAIGYQSHLRSILNCSTLNYGDNGATLSEIRDGVVARSYTTKDFVTLTGGVNDWWQSQPIGAIDVIGGTFDTDTSYGALQSMIEHILTDNPACRIFLIAPIRARGDTPGEMPETYAEMFLAVGELYGIPVCDWYHNVGFNPLNYDYYYKDIGASANRDIHVGDEGYKRMGEYLAAFLLANC